MVFHSKRSNGKVLCNLTILESCHWKVFSKCIFFYIKRLITVTKGKENTTKSYWRHRKHFEFHYLSLFPVNHYKCIDFLIYFSLLKMLPKYKNKTKCTYSLNERVRCCFSLPFSFMFCKISLQMIFAKKPN